MRGDNMCQIGIQLSFDLYNLWIPKIMLLGIRTLSFFPPLFGLTVFRTHPEKSSVVPRSTLVRDDVTHGSVQFMAACLLPRYLFEKTDCQHGSALREETPQGKTLEYKYRIPLLPPCPSICQTRFLLCFLKLRSLCQATNVAKAEKEISPLSICLHNSTMI